MTPPPRCPAISWYGEQCLEPEGHASVIEGSKHLWHTTGFCVWATKDAVP